MMMIYGIMEMILVVEYMKFVVIGCNEFCDTVKNISASLG